MIVIICFNCLWRRADHKSMLLQLKEKKKKLTAEDLCFHHWFSDTRAYSLIKNWCVACFEAAVTLLATVQCQRLKLWDEAWTCLSKEKKKDAARISNSLLGKYTAVKALVKLVYNSQPVFKLAKKTPPTCWQWASFCALLQIWVPSNHRLYNRSRHLNHKGHPSPLSTCFLWQPLSPSAPKWLFIWYECRILPASQLQRSGSWFGSYRDRAAVAPKVTTLRSDWKLSHQEKGHGENNSASSSYSWLSHMVDWVEPNFSNSQLSKGWRSCQCTHSNENSVFWPF